MIALLHLAAGEWIGIGSAAVGVAALALGLIQAWPTLTGHRAEATAKRQAAGQWLQRRTPELEATEKRISTEAAAGNRGGAADALREWRRIAPEYQALLQSADVTDDALEQNLEFSLGLMDSALEELNDVRMSPDDACRPILRHIRAVCVHSRRVATGMR